MRVCVIGANGFIGRSAVAELQAAGFKVRATVRDPEATLPDELQLPGVEVTKADVTQSPLKQSNIAADASSEAPSGPLVVDHNCDLVKAVADCEVVVNCAGIYRWWMLDNAEYARVNDQGARNVAYACGGIRDAAEQPGDSQHTQTVQPQEYIPSVKHLVHISTAMSFGYPEDMPFSEDSKPGPHASEYVRTKFLGDQALLGMHKASQFPSQLALTILYLGCVTGAGDTFSRGRPHDVYRDFMRGKIPLLVAPDTKYIYVHIRDVRRAIAKVCKSTASASTVSGAHLEARQYLIGNSREILTTRSYFEMMGKHCGRQAPRFSLPLNVGMGLAYGLTGLSRLLPVGEPALPIDLMRTAYWGGIVYDCSKSERELGLQYESIDVAVRESIEDVKVRSAL